MLTFGTFIAGNTTALVLAELGADVVKVEALARPEVLRSPPYSFGATSIVEPSGVGNTVMYAGLSRSTRNLSLEMNTEEGRALFKRLVAVADVVIENFGAETMRHWACSFDELVAVNPRLVMASLSGYGRTGPRGTYLAYATNISNFSGLTTTWELPTRDAQRLHHRHSRRDRGARRGRATWTGPVPVCSSTSRRPKRSARCSHRSTSIP